MIERHPNILASLNAPYGARCFLTAARSAMRLTGSSSLNAPYGARCFLTGSNLPCPRAQ